MTDSATGGFLRPLPAPAPVPLEGQALNRFVQQYVVGITGMDGKLVRPRWQTEPPNIPDAGELWAAIGLALSWLEGGWAFVKHTNDGDVYQRHQDMQIASSFYDTGVNGRADEAAGLLRDGIAIPQNMEELTRNGMGIASSDGQIVTMPGLVKSRWLYRADYTFTIRRELRRLYAVQSVASMQGTLYTDIGIGPSAIVVNPPQP